MALGFLALTLVMGCAGIDPSTARGKEALAVHNLAIWYLSQTSNQRNLFLEWWFILYYMDYEDYLMSLQRHARYPSSPSEPSSPWSPSPGPSIPVSFNTSGPQNTIQMLTTNTIPPTLPPQQQTLPPPPPPPPPPAPTPSPQPPPP
jgi:hypothetical protein